MGMVPIRCGKTKHRADFVNDKHDPKTGEFAPKIGGGSDPRTHKRPEEDPKTHGAPCTYKGCHRRFKTDGAAGRHEREVHGDKSPPRSFNPSSYRGPFGGYKR